MGACTQFGDLIGFVVQMIALYQRVFDTFLNVFSFLSIRTFDLSSIFASLFDCGG